MTFKEYLSTRRVTDTPQGDFTSDARSDKRMPDVASWQDLRSYLHRTVGDDMIDDVLESARLVWAAYRAKVRNA